jgi:hypothetical protein
MNQFVTVRCFSFTLTIRINGSNYIGNYIGVDSLKIMTKKFCNHYKTLQNYKSKLYWHVLSKNLIYFVVVKGHSFFCWNKVHLTSEIKKWM